jgi:membrane protein
MWAVLTTAANDWLRHHDARLGAALAYYSVFSMGPLLLIVVSIAGLFFGGDAVREALTGQFRSVLGPTEGASSPNSGVLSAIVGVVFLLVSALGVVVPLKDALNTIWEPKEPESAGVWWYLRTYLTSFAGILVSDFSLRSPSSSAPRSLHFRAGLVAASPCTGSWLISRSRSRSSRPCSPCCSSGFPTQR